MKQTKHTTIAKAALLKALTLLLMLFAGHPAAWASCRILVHGDSLSAAYGLKREEGWVTLLQSRLEEKRYACEVINSSISGETTAGGLSRLPSLLERHKPSHLVLELGANDGLRGLDTNAMQTNLQRMVELARSAGSKVVLVGIRVPPNYGKAYQQRFDNVFTTMAQNFRLPYVVSLLDGFEAERSAFQPDGLHPVAGVQIRMLDNVWPHLQKTL